MTQRRGGGGTITRRGWRSSTGVGRRREGGLVGLRGIGLLGAFLAGGPCRAQDLRLTVRPHAIAIAPRTEHAGLVRLAHTEAYVPPQCVGTRRCPLLLWSNIGSELTPMADKYGLITAVVNFIDEDGSRELMDQALTELLQGLAIDPDRIALLGMSATGAITTEYAAQNLDVFSRIALLTEHGGEPPPKTPGHSNEYYIATGLLGTAQDFEVADRLRALGYPVTFTIQFRGHGTNEEDLEFLGHWLQESWALPDPAARPPAPVFGEPPRLTVDMLARMTAFWTRFMAEPESIRTTARRAHVREVVLPFGTKRFSTLMVDMAALAAACPSVAAALKAAGLTPEQHDVYRAALASAKEAGILKSGEGDLPAFLTPASAVAQNLAFLAAHPKEWEALAVTGMWRTP